MQQITIFGDSSSYPADFDRQFHGIIELEFKPLESIRDAALTQVTVVDIDLDNSDSALSAKDLIRRKPKDAKLIFVTEKASHLQEVRAYALGATDVIHRPIDGRALLAKCWGDVASLAVDLSSPAVHQTPGVVAAVKALQNIFSAACLGVPFNSSEVQSAGIAIVSQIEAQGLAAWIDTVRMHHSQTYQHCLLVTGLAAAFGQHIGASRADRHRLTIAGMLHDIGKSRIPLAILEKSGPLDANEWAVMKNHPQYGFNALSTAQGLSAEMLDMVLHHHEYLDGSGYPHGLQRNEISDLVRIMTISDVFGALIERRSYRAPMSGDAAYQTLLDMGPKLDNDLVREFKFAAVPDPNRLGV